METPRTGTTASAPEHDSSTAQLDGEVSERRARTLPAGAEETAPEPGSRPGSVPGTEISPGTETAPGAPSTGRRTVALAVAGLAVAVLLLSGLSLSIGAEVGVGGVLDYLLDRGGARDNARLSLVVGDLRLPRTLTALLVGAALGVAGCLLQAVTRNPLAETGLLGVNAGASLGVVAGIALLGFDSGYAYLVCAFVGAVVASGLVLLISGRRGGGSPMRQLAGAALGATFGGLTSVIVVNSAETYDRFRFWVGSLAGVEGFGELGRLAPVLAIGFPRRPARRAPALRPRPRRRPGPQPRPPAARHPARSSPSASPSSPPPPSRSPGPSPSSVCSPDSSPEPSPAPGRPPPAGLIGAGVLAVDVAALDVSRPFEAPVSVIVALIGAPVLIAIVRSKQLSSMGMTEPATEERAPDRPRRFKLALPRPGRAVPPRPSGSARPTPWSSGAVPSPC
ncbi:Iron complex transport system permease protein OS=Streptomyces microflavus OX=1919 GN=Smic_00460 PE=3 SV=1 [Streptomyces microflavus]